MGRTCIPQSCAEGGSVPPRYVVNDCIEDAFAIIGGRGLRLQRLRRVLPKQEGCGIPHRHRGK